MLKGVLIKRKLFRAMPQKLISSFLKPPKGQKRKHDETEENIQSSLISSCGSNDGSVENSSVDSVQDKAAIIALAKAKPALYSNIGLTWFKALQKEFSEPNFEELSRFLEGQRKQFTIYPPEEDVYSWTNAVEIHEVKVVILGQDPYPGPKQAHGLAFSVRKGVAVPKSLKNIYKELSQDIPGFIEPKHGYLHGWATQGVLLLNTCLTVRAGDADSHKERGWEPFTDSVIKWISNNLSHVVFMLWGEKAKKKSSIIHKNKHLLLTAPHPSPLSAHRGFIGCQHFSKANDYLQKWNKKTIDWTHLP